MVSVVRRQPEIHDHWWNCQIGLGIRAPPSLDLTHRLTINGVAYCSVRHKRIKSLDVLEASYHSHIFYACQAPASEMPRFTDRCGKTKCSGIGITIPYTLVTDTIYSLVFDIRGPALKRSTGEPSRGHSQILGQFRSDHSSPAHGNRVWSIWEWRTYETGHKGCELPQPAHAACRCGFTSGINVFPW